MDKYGFIWNFPLFTIVLSLFSGVLCTVLPHKAAKIYTLIYEGILIVLVACVLWLTIRTGTSFTYPMGEFPAPWGNEIRAGALEALLALLFMIVLLCSVLAGSRFLMTDLDESKIHLYYSLINLMTAALMAIVWTNDLFTGYVFVEILTLTSCGVLIVREIGRTTLAAMRYMILNLMGSGLFLLGVVLLYDMTGHLLMVPMHQAVLELAADPSNIQILSLAVGILTIGLAIKCGLFPFHYWMPDAYGRATPVSASVLSSLVSKCYIFLLIKVYLRVLGPELMDRLPIGKVLFVLGICGMVFGSVSAIRANNINRMTAFSSAAQIGYIFMGIGIGGLSGYIAAVFHMFAHAVTKSQLFLTTPRLAEVSGDSLLFRKLQGAAIRDRWAGRFFGVGSFSMIGIPIFAGFAAKLLFGMAAMDSQSPRKLILTLLALAVSSVLNAMYFIRTLIRIYIPSKKREPVQDRANGQAAESAADPDLTGHKNAPAEAAAADDDGQARGRAEYVIPMIVLTAGNVFLGLFSWAVVDVIRLGLECLI